MTEVNIKAMEEKDRLNLLHSLFKFFTYKKIDMSSFNDRLRFQKIIYIMNSAGIDLDYRFGWHLRGPYSSSLASDGFALTNRPETFIDIPYRVPEKCAKIIENIREKFSNDITDISKLELFAAILFIAKSEGESTDSEIVERVRNRKPWFDESTIESALHRLRESGLFGI